MKRILLITILTFILIFSITGCEENKEKKEQTKTEEKKVLKLKKIDSLN